MSSRTYSVRSGQIYGQNRGRGRATDRRPGITNTYTPGRTNRMYGDPTRHNQEQNVPSPPTDSRPSVAGAEGRMERRAGYTVIPPDQRKHQEITQKAQEEETRYKEYKAQKRVTHVSYVGSVGGGQVQLTEARQRFQQENIKRNQQTWKKIHTVKQQKKSIEDAEIEKKKLEARRKAEQNEKAERDRAAGLREHHRRVNEDFLNRLEQKDRRATARRENTHYE